MQEPHGLRPKVYLVQHLISHCGQFEASQEATQAKGESNRLPPLQLVCLGILPLHTDVSSSTLGWGDLSPPDPCSALTLSAQPWVAGGFFLIGLL